MTDETVGAPVRILVVDDEEEHRRLAGEMLTTNDPSLEVVEASSLATAVELVASSNPPDAVVLDIGLPDVPASAPTSGVQLLAALPAAPPIVAVSAARLVELDDVVRAGADDYLAKTQMLEPHRLLHAVHTARARHAQRRSSLDCAEWLTGGRELGHLGRHLTHDLRTPVAVALLAAETLRGDEVPTTTRDSLHTMIEERLSSLLLRFSAIVHSIDQHGGGPRTDRSPLELPALAERAAARLDPAVAGRLALGRVDDVRAWGHPEELVVALWSLFDNAVRHNPEREQVRVDVTAAASEDAVVLEVRDDGAGIHPDHHEAAFGVGWHGPDGGAGVGLAAVRARLRAAGASIEACDGVDGGAGFRITMPQRVGERRGRRAEDAPDT